MKKIEITNLINEKISKEQLEFRDLLNKTIYINSYEKFVQVFSLLENTYKDKIPEFYNIAENYLKRIENFINSCKTHDEVGVSELIYRNFFSSIFDSNYTRNTNLKLIFPSSLNNNLECSEDAINQIYFELGYDKLIDYIELLKNPSSLNSYLSTTSKQDVAMHYILFKTNHHSNTRFKRNLSSNNLYKQMEDNINNSIKQIVAEKDDYIQFMNNEKEKIEEWYSKSNQAYIDFMKVSNENYENFMVSCTEKINNLERTYSEKLKVEKPAEFMKKKSDEYAKKTAFWVFIDVVIAIILLGLLAIIINPKIEVNEKIISINLFAGEMPIYSSIIILAMICLIIYILRIMIKMTISSYHLCEEYKQKYILSYFYLSLINEGKMDEKVGQTILTLLFSKADTGLIKNDNGGEYESIVKMLTSSGK